MQLRALPPRGRRAPRERRNRRTAYTASVGRKSGTRARAIERGTIDQLPRSRHPKERLASPVIRHQTVTDMGMNRGAGTRPMVVVIGLLVRNRRSFKQRQEPVPVQQRHVGIGFGRRVPPQQVIVVIANLARTVVMANVVIVGLRQRHVNHTQHHDPDEQDARPRCLPSAPPDHDETPIS